MLEIPDSSMISLYKLAIKATVGLANGFLFNLIRKIMRAHDSISIGHSQSEIRFVSTQGLYLCLP